MCICHSTRHFVSPWSPSRIRSTPPSSARPRPSVRQEHTRALQRIGRPCQSRTRRWRGNAVCRATTGDGSRSRDGARGRVRSHDYPFLQEGHVRYASVRASHFFRLALVSRPWSIPTSIVPVCLCGLTTDAPPPRPSLSLCALVAVNRVRTGRREVARCAVEHPRPR